MGGGKSRGRKDWQGDNSTSACAVTVLLLDNTVAQRLRDRDHHFIREPHGRVFHAFRGHAVADRVGFVQGVGMMKADLFVPGLGPGSTVVAGEP